jgi:hypothetical protein
LINAALALFLFIIFAFGLIFVAVWGGAVERVWRPGGGGDLFWRKTGCASDLLNKKRGEKELYFLYI